MNEENWQTFGFLEIKTILEKQLQQRRFAHAYLFTGPGGIGKKTLALEFAKKILNSSRLDNHPDFILLDDVEKMGVEEARALISSLNFRPFSGEFKVAVINNLERMSQQALNALLKTVEEPSESTILILISTSRKPLPTLASRCQVFSFNHFTDRQLRDFAAGENLPVERDALVASLGAVARLKILAEDRDKLSAEQSLLKEFDILKKAPLAERLLKVGELSEWEDDKLRDLFMLWLAQAKRVVNQDGWAGLAVLQTLVNAWKDLAGNKNRKLILQEALLKL